MSPQKITFFVFSGIALLWLIYGAWVLSQKTETQSSTKESLTIWVTEGTTDQYTPLIEGFKKTKPEYTSANIEIRVFPEYTQYQKILLNTLADGKGPDIFMVDAGGDAILADKVEPIPSTVLDFSTFEKEFESIFLPLLSSTGSKDEEISYLKWVPLGYETIGMFYNKSLLRSIPATWNDILAMYADSTVPSVIPTNIGLSSRYTPMNIDILWAFLAEDEVYSYESIGKNGGNAIKKYSTYANMTPTQGSPSESDELISNIGTSLTEKKGAMNASTPWLTTVDLFMRGDIAIIFGYPSLIHAIEHAKKRAGSNAVDALILTEKLPQNSLGKTRNYTAKYSYLGLSRQTKNQYLGVAFLQYLLSDEAQSKYIAEFPTKIPAKPSLYKNLENVSISKVFGRAKIGAFIPETGSSLRVFDFGIRDEFQEIFDEYIDRTWEIDISNLSNLLSSQIQCSLESLSSGKVDSSCDPSR